jgi:hypothetical protein
MQPQPQPQPSPQAGGEDAPAPPSPTPAQPFVVEPLFAGDEESERETRVYDRDPVTTEKPAPERPKDAERAYERGAETDILKVRLGGREERVVRRYLEALRQKGEAKK